MAKFHTPSVANHNRFLYTDGMTRRSMRWGLVVVLSAWTAFSLLLTHSALRATASFDAATAAVQDHIWQPAAVAAFDGQSQRLVVPSWRLLDHDRLWVYVGKHASLPADFTPALAPLSDIAVGDWVDDKRLHPRALTALRGMMTAAERAGQPVLVSSAYRSYDHQQSLMRDMTRLYGTAYVQDYVALPGQSEHQTGLAVDFTSYSPQCQAAFTNCALTDAAARWLAAHAHEHGFILRYPPGKTALTGVLPESWHFRYVGKDMAQLIYQSGLTFDEVYDQLKRLRSIGKPDAV